MSERFVSYEAWGSCEDCGFHGLVEFRHRDDEDYDDGEALGVMLDSTCPSCGQVQAVLVVIEEYQEMLRSARTGKGS
ncbi:MAG: hypothetical protein R3286_17075 [Gammaproteobacteria bacterium]|nr:hypothetical protein [Gammaproteobacteria bacterium]